MLYCTCVLVTDDEDTNLPEYNLEQLLSDLRDVDEDNDFMFMFASRNSFITNDDCSFWLELKFKRNVKQAVLFFRIV